MYVTIPSIGMSNEGFSGKCKNGTVALRPTTRTQAVEVCFKAGSHLFFEGDTVERLYEVTSGVIRLTRLLEDGRRQVIAFGYPGDVVGFPIDGVHHTDCDVLCDARLRSYPRSALDACKSDPELHRQLLCAALREIAEMQDHFMMLGRKSASEKVASFLGVLVDRVGESLGQYTQIKLPMSRADIADFLGLTTETVSRTLTQMRKSKIIAIDNIHTVVILRPQALRTLSQGFED